MATLVNNTSTAPARSWWKFWKWKRQAQPKGTAQTANQMPQQASTDTTNFYQRAIEWTHRADKVINLILGYLLAIASVLGFMDVLSNGEVLSSVPYAFYVWLAIMGLGVDFQILLVIGRMPDLAKTVENGWLRFIFFVFNIAFLAFLCYMSIIIAAVFTQHRDVPGTIAQAMNALGIDSTRFVFERAALATLLLVLMAVDRTMERWRLQIVRPATDTIALPVTQQSEQHAISTPVQTNDLEKLLNAMQTMNQQTLQAMATMQQQSMQVTIEQVTRVTVEAMRDTLTALPAYQPPQIAAPLSSDQKTPSINADGKPEMGLPNEQNNSVPNEQSYGDQIEALYKDNPKITAVEVERQIGCSRTTAASWLRKVRPVKQENSKQAEKEG